MGAVHNLDRGVLNPPPCELRIDTDVNSHADETVMEPYANMAYHRGKWERGEEPVRKNQIRSGNEI